MPAYIDDHPHVDATQLDKVLWRTGGAGVQVQLGVVKLFQLKLVVAPRKKVSPWR